MYWYEVTGRKELAVKQFALTGTDRVKKKEVRVVAKSSKVISKKRDPKLRSCRCKEVVNRSTSFSPGL